MAAKAKTSRAQSPKALNEKQELFCQYFVLNDLLRGNATLCYNEAYKYDLDELPDGDAVFKKGKLIEKSTHGKAYNLCSVEGARLLRNPRIQIRLTTLRNTLLTDEVVDSKLAEVIVQDKSYHARMMGISEFNKLRQRITEKVDLTSKGEAISAITYAGPQ